MSITQLALELLVTTLAITNALAQAVEPPIQHECSTTVLGSHRTHRCAATLTCVLTSFGKPSAEMPNTGLCRHLPGTPPSCTVPWCGGVGLTGICNISGQVVTCGAWAKRHDGDVHVPNCALPCPTPCSEASVIASDGSAYCGLCALHAASCRKGFKIHGPIANVPAPCRAPIEATWRADCCADFGIGCLPCRAECSTNVSHLGCAKGLRCIVHDFGEPAKHLASVALCVVATARPRECDVAVCTSAGYGGMCVLDKDVVLCGAWAQRLDGGARPNCSFTCKSNCESAKRKPVGSDGNPYGNLCQLQRKSCLSHFKMRGPVLMR